MLPITSTHHLPVPEGLEETSQRNTDPQLSGHQISISTTVAPPSSLRGEGLGRSGMPALSDPEIVPMEPEAVPLPIQQQDAQLEVFLQRYLQEEKRPVAPEKAIAFIAEQSRQLALPKEQRDLSRAKQLYLAMFDVDDAKFEKIKGGTFSSGWIGSGSLYALSGQLMSFAAMIPAIYSASVSDKELKQNPVYYAWLNFAMQLGISVATPLVNSAMQIVLVARQELMRGEGQSMRSKEMKARAYPEVAAAMRTINNEMDQLATDMQNELGRLSQAPAEGAEPATDRLNNMAQQAMQLMARCGELQHEFQTRHDVIDLNYIGQFHQSLVRVFRSVVNMTSAVAGLETANTHLGNFVQIGGTLAAMGVQQFWAGPRDVYNKEQATLEGTIMSTRLVRPHAQDISPAELTAQDLDLSDLPNQWKGPIETARTQFQEYLDIEINYCEQAIGDLVHLQPHELRRLETLELKLQGDEPLQPQEHEELEKLRGKRIELPADSHKAELHQTLQERLVLLRSDREHLKSNTWMEMSEQHRGALLKAVSGDHPWSLSAQTAWARMRLPADLIAQIAQRFGSQFAMILAGTNMPLIMNALIRVITAYKREEGKKPPIPDGWRDTLSVTFMMIAIMGALTTGAGVNDKITQRARMKSQADKGEISSRVGFQPRLVGLQMKAILQAMFAFPSALLQRRGINSAVAESRASRQRLESTVERSHSQLPGTSDAVVPR
jgi:outer membrane murein-binding lipoprotein Lpp